MHSVVKISKAVDMKVYNSLRHTDEPQHTCFDTWHGSLTVKPLVGPNRETAQSDQSVAT